jgi:hypothetical protein
LGRGPAENGVPKQTAALKTTETFTGKRRLSRRRAVFAGSLAAVAFAAGAYAVMQRGDDAEPVAKPSHLSVHQKNQLLVHLRRGDRFFHEESFLNVLPVRQKDEIRLVVDVPDGLAVELWMIDSLGNVQEFTGGEFDPNTPEGKRFIYPPDDQSMPMDDQPGTELVLAAARPRGAVWRRPLRERLRAAIVAGPIPDGIPRGTVVYANLDEESVRSADGLDGRGVGAPRDGGYARLQAVLDRVAALRRELLNEPELKLLSITAFPHERETPSTP